MARVEKTNKTSEGIEVVVVTFEVGFMPDIVARSRVRARALAATGFAFGDPSETEELLTRLTDIKSVEELSEGKKRYTVLVDTPL